MTTADSGRALKRMAINSIEVCSYPFLAFVWRGLTPG